MSRVKIILGFLICFLAIGGFVLAEIAEAQRLGGSRSFGSRPSQQRPAQQPAQPQREAPTQQQTQQQTQQNRQTQQQAAQQTPARSGFGGMLGGMLGGLLLGGLIGSLLTGGLGAFSGLNFLDILLFGGILYLLYRFIRSRRMAAQTAGPNLDQSPSVQPEYIHHRQSTPPTPAPAATITPGSKEKSAWDALNTEPANTPSSGIQVPEGFDTADFLIGAKAAYTRLQTSWNNRDMEDIRNFTTKEVFAEIKRQQNTAPMMGQTELLHVEASLLEVREEDGDTVCSVLFDVTLREDPLEEAKQTQEIWHFSRPSEGTGMWLLEGIQQVN
ncbi:Tim44 domain-containing protein [Desulfonatronum parangueonense]